MFSIQYSVEEGEYEIGIEKESRIPYSCEKNDTARNNTSGHADTPLVQSTRYMTGSGVSATLFCYCYCYCYRAHGTPGVS